MSQVQFNLPPEFVWQATDEDGDIGFYTHKPYKHQPFSGWVSDEGKDLSIQGVGNKCPDWENSLEYIGDKGVIKVEI